MKTPSTFTNYDQIVEYLYQLAPTGKIFAGEAGIKRTRNLLELLGNPQNQLKIIHIAGTSGKGSTAYILAHLLNQQQLKIGLTVSPHISDFRERFQIDLQFLHKDKVFAYIAEVLNQAQKLEQTELGMPTYFEIVSVIAFYIFAREQVDYAVIETGFGGLLDATNMVDRADKICIITPIDFDHQHILGNTLTEIATQKAGIIHNDNQVFSSPQQPEAQKVLEQTAHQQNASIYFLLPNEVSVTDISQSGTKFTFAVADQKQAFNTNLIGHYQAYNVALALKAFRYLCDRDHLSTNFTKINNVLQYISIPGRCELIKTASSQNVILDGAHNPHKMSSFINTLRHLFPDNKINFVIAFKKSKDYAAMLPAITSIANRIVLTNFFPNTQLGNLAVNPHEIALALDHVGFIKYQVIPDPQTALQSLSSEIQIPIVVTGSFYLVSDLRAHLIPQD